MATISVPTLAGIASTVIFAWSVLPMLAKAHRTRDLASYSLGNLLLANVGNAVHSVYVFSLPAGPIWVLHGFYLATSWLMLVWCLRYGRVRRSAQTTLEGRFARSSTTPKTSVYCSIRGYRPSHGHGIPRQAVTADLPPARRAPTVQRHLRDHRSFGSRHASTVRASPADPRPSTGQCGTPLHPRR
jgi:hypothetical protein